MSVKRDSEINNAFFQGLIGLAAVFFTIKELIQQINVNLFLVLIILFLLTSVARIFGTILEYKRLQSLSLDLFKLIVTPFTVYVFARIFVTQIANMPTQANTLPVILGFGVAGYMLGQTVEIKASIRVKVKRRIKLQSS